jgi:hypothetical protein
MVTKRKALSTIGQIREDRKPIAQTVVETSAAIDDDERALLAKLKAKYENEEHGERIPGKRVQGQKTTWTFKDCERMFPIVDFVSDETIPLNFQGIKVQLRSGVEYHLPSCFKKIYDDHRRAARPEAPPPGVTVELGAGPLPPR